MANPVAIGTTAVQVVPVRRNRANVKFQNVGNSTLYFKRGSAPTATDFEYMLTGTGSEANEAVFSTESISDFFVLSSTANGSLAVFETIYI